MNAQAIVQRTCSGETFTHLADEVVRALRTSMFVPERADEDVEAEFSAFRLSLDAYYPEFSELFASALVAQVGQARLESLLSALCGESPQRYLVAAGRIERELEQHLPRLKQELTAMAQAALSGGAALSSGHPRALSLARATGAYDALQRLARTVTRQTLLGRRGAASGATPLEDVEVQRIQDALLGKLVGFHARSFIHHVGEQHVAGVLEELQREPLLGYIVARHAMKPALDRGLHELVLRMMKEVF